MLPTEAAAESGRKGWTETATRRVRRSRMRWSNGTATCGRCPCVGVVGTSKVGRPASTRREPRAGAVLQLCPMLESEAGGGVIELEKVDHDQV
jgi:hypothetical protein